MGLPFVTVFGYPVIGVWHMKGVYPTAFSTTAIDHPILAELQYTHCKNIFVTVVHAGKNSGLVDLTKYIAI